MMSIFNIFDPTTFYFISMNWIYMYLPLLFMLSVYWLTPSRWLMTWNFLYLNLNTELNLILKKKIYKINFMSMFIMILLINFMGLFSYIFTSSSHMTMNLSLSLPFWLSFMIIGWFFNYNKMLIHQIPYGTPNLLMPFMIIIEFISNLIRPGTLSIRLTANMIAGHLLLTLMSENGKSLIFIFSLILILSQTLLMILELSVAFIQAYVFTMLSSLYSSEI